MHKYVYHDVKDFEDKTEVAFHNMKIADNLHSLQIFIYGQMGYFNANPTKTYQDLELELRKRNFNTHLIAKLPPKNTDKVHYKIAMPKIENDQTEYKFECITSCRPKEYAIKELLESWNSYEENFEALKVSGIICVSDPIDKNKSVGSQDLSESCDKSQKIIMTEKADPMTKMQENLVRIEAVFMSAEEFVKNIIAQTKLDRGVEPELALYAMGYNGEPIMAITLGNKIMSHIGVKMGYANSNDNSECKQTMTLVDLTKLKS
jgi:hypothetical protein